MHRLNRIVTPANPAANISPSHIAHPSEPQTGTIMWVGDRLNAESKEVYRYCEENIPQIAYRANMDDAIARPATSVSQVLIHRSDRRPSMERQLYQLACAYPDATLMEMFGSMWEGHVYQREIPLGTQQFYWHQWNQVLPPMFGRTFADRPSQPSSSPNPSVAIIASRFADADPLMDLATSVGAVSVWCRSSQIVTTRNCSVIWWDDSAAPAASEMVWRERIATVEKYSSIRPQHIWLAGAPRVHQYIRARNGGIDIIFSKPQRIEALVSTLVGYRTNIGAPTATMTHPGTASATTSQAEIMRNKRAA